jgi:sulfide dehydrogenase cytochrome subunit
MRVAFSLMLAMAPGAALAMEAPPGAATCSGCHAGPSGAGMVDIAGRDPAELSATMEAFRSGARPATLMNRLVRGFSPDEVRAIASWLAVQK